MALKTTALLSICIIATAGIVSAGPVDNARQFQEKAARTAVRSSDVKSTRPNKGLITIEDTDVVKKSGRTKENTKPAPEEKKGAAGAR